MKYEKELPSIIKEVGFDFDFDFENDPKKIWNVSLSVVKIPIDWLVWHLEIPFWSSDNGFYDLSPKQLMACPELSLFHYRKVLEADLSFPIDYTLYKGRKKIIDGLHRLTKADMIGLKEIEAKEVPLALLLEIIRTKSN